MGTSTPRGISVRIEGVKPSLDDAYRRSEPELGRLIIEYRWRDDVGTKNLVGQVIGCASAWVLVGVVFLHVLFGADSNWQALPVCLILFTVMVMVSYPLVASIWNSTTVTVDAERLVACHGPISFVANREIARRDFAELYCKKTELSGNKSPSHSFALVARLRSGTEVEIMGHLGDPEPCLFAAQQISAYLKRTATEHERA
jgi:hypothetical protein